MCKFLKVYQLLLTNVLIYSCCYCVAIVYLLAFIFQEFQQLKDQLHEKVKENKRLKENFDTLKMANDTLNKEVCKNAKPFSLRLFDVVCCL